MLIECFTSASAVNDADFFSHKKGDVLSLTIFWIFYDMVDNRVPLDMFDNSPCVCRLTEKLEGIELESLKKTTFFGYLIEML